MRIKSRICRLCMGYKNINKDIVDKQIYSKIKECLQLEIDPDDANLPISICADCIKSVRKFYTFRKECWKVQRLLISRLRHRDFIQIVNVASINLPAFEDIALTYGRKRKCTIRPAIKKEMTIEIQEVERPSPSDTIRSGNLLDSPQNLLEPRDITHVATANRFEETKQQTAETHSPKPKATEATAPEIITQESIGMHLECLEPESLEAESVESDAGDAGCGNTEALELESLDHDALESEVSEPKALGEALDPEVLEREALKHLPLDPEVLEPEALEPETLETTEAFESKALNLEALESEALEPEDLEPEVLESEAWEPEIIEPEFLKPEQAIQLEVLETESHLKPHDYTTKQASSSVAASPTTRPRPRRKTNISGKALYKSLLMACDTCGKMVERNRMEGHRNKHMGLRPYSCPHEACDAAFHCKHARRLHVRCRHGNESFSCDMCEKVYRARRDLLGHQREAHSEPKFDCDICAKKFTTRSRLKQHRYYHTGERNHPCALCAMTFFNNFQLKVHMRTHTQARPFVCKVCKKAFRYRHMAKDHIVRQHGIDERLEKDWIIHHPEPDISEIISQ
uniref:Protein krueppel n=1 Tax=Anopheles atroparvus TaxID=41427 RepID=A0AAG5DEM2_ANOAO